MKLLKNFAIFIFCLGLCHADLPAKENAQPVFTVTDTNPTGLYQPGETITFRISGENFDPTDEKNKATFRLLGNGGVELRPPAQVSANPMTVTVDAEKPGFVWCEVTSGTPKKVVKHFVGIQPEKYQAEATLPKDFEDYWQKQIARLNEIPMNPVVSEVEIPQAAFRNQVKAYDIKLDSLGEIPVIACLTMPADASAEKRYPIRVSFHGHTYFPQSGSHLKVGPAAVQKTIFLDVNPHGLPYNQPPEYYKTNVWPALLGSNPYPYRNWDDRDQVYFHGMFLRVVRALEYAKSRPEWDGKNLIVEGSSMGGAQALVGAALDSQVSACIANVPAMGDMIAAFPGWPKLLTHVKKASPEAVRENAPYYDTANFAKLVKVPTLVGVGLNDAVCPPPTIWAIFNNLQSPKEIIVSIGGGHDWNPEMNAALLPWINAHLKKAVE